MSNVCIPLDIDLCTYAYVASLCTVQSHIHCEAGTGIQQPGVLDNVYMWVKNEDGQEVLDMVGVWVVCCGLMGDGPMRQLLNQSLSHSAERGCDCCGILAKKGSLNANKYIGWGIFPSTLR